MHLRGRAGDEIDRVVVRTTPHKREKVSHPVTYPEAEHFRIELHGSLDVGHIERDMPQLVGRDASPTRSVRDGFVLGEHLDTRSLVVFEGHKVPDVRLTVTATGR